MGTRAGDVPVVATRFGSLGAVAVRRHRAWFDAKVIDDKRVWTSAAGAYAGNVAEHTMMLLLAGVRSLPEQLAAQSWRKEEFDRGWALCRARQWRSSVAAESAVR